MSRLKILLPVMLGLLVLIVVAAVMVNRRPAPEAPDGVTWATPAPYEDEYRPLAGAGREILVHCGNSMRPGAEALAALFQEREGVAVRFNFGGSAELLPAIELGGRGDLYLCHDPYAKVLAEKGLLDTYETVGYLQPVIIVPAGNPRGVTSLADLAAPGLRVGLPDARYATAAKLAREKLREMGLEEGFDRNLLLETRGHNDQALAVISGHLDASVVWSFIPFFYPEELSRVDPGADFPEIRVTLCLLTGAADSEAARRFMRLAASPEGLEIMNRHGYGRDLF